MVTGSLGLAIEHLAPDGGGGGLALGQRVLVVSRRTRAPQSRSVSGLLGSAWSRASILVRRPRRTSGPGELRDQGEPQVASGGGELDGLVEPGVGLGGASHAGEGASQPDEGLDVVGLFLGPLFVVGDEPGLVVVSEEDLFDLAPDFAMEPAIGPELAEHGLEVVESVVGSSEPDFQVGGLHGELDLAEGVGGFFGEGLEARQGGGGLVFLGEGGGDLLLDARVAGEERFEAVPDLEGLVVFLGALVDAAEGLEDVEEVGAGGLAFEGAFEGGGGLFGLTDQDEGLAEIIRRAGDRRVAWFRPCGGR